MVGFWTTTPTGPSIWYEWSHSPQILSLLFLLLLLRPLSSGMATLHWIQNVWIQTSEFINFAALLEVFTQSLPPPISSLKSVPRRKYWATFLTDKHSTMMKRTTLSQSGNLTQNKEGNSNVELSCRRFQEIIISKMHMSNDNVYVSGWDFSIGCNRDVGVDCASPIPVIQTRLSRTSQDYPSIDEKSTD